MLEDMDSWIAFFYLHGSPSLTLDFKTMEKMLIFSIAMVIKYAFTGDFSLFLGHR